tara:strand:+ start:499 stop:807 length:309 start_codon:yes stop_codon:yes gene_type:complete
MTHTKTPWQVAAQGKIEGLNFAGCRVKSIVQHSDSAAGSITTTVAEIIGEDDAAHIVRCVNSHDALVAALELVLEYRVPKINPLSDAAILSARAALALARGE